MEKDIPIATWKNSMPAQFSSQAIRHAVVSNNSWYDDNQGNLTHNNKDNSLLMMTIGRTWEIKVSSTEETLSMKII